MLFLRGLITHTEAYDLGNQNCNAGQKSLGIVKKSTLYMREILTVQRAMLLYVYLL